MGQANYIQGSIEKSAALLIAEAAKSGVEAHHLAQRKIEECQAARDVASMQFWRNVWIQIMSRKYPENPREGKFIGYNSGEIIL